MTDVYLNGRLAVGWEVAAVEHGYRCAHERDLALLAGLLAQDPAPSHAGRFLDDLPALP